MTVRSVFRFCLIVFIGLTLSACQQDSTTLNSKPLDHAQADAKTIDKINAPQVFERDDAVWIKLPTGKEQRLTDQGMGYSISIAPNGHWLTIDKAILSNIQVTKLFQRQTDGTYLEMSTPNISTLAWSQWSSAHGIPSNDVINPRTRTTSWGEDNNHIVIELTGLDPDGEYIEDTLKFNLTEH